MIVIFGQISAYSAFNLSQFALGQDCLCRTFRLAYAAVDALVGMDDQHVVALVETIDGAHFDAIHIFALDAIVSDHIGHDDVPVAAGFSRKNSANLTPANALGFKTPLQALLAELGKGCANPLLLTPLRFAPESGGAFFPGKGHTHCFDMLQGEQLLWRLRSIHR